MSQSRLISLLAGALMSVDGDGRRFKRVEALQHDPLPMVIDKLKLIESETTNSIDVRLISLAKQALTGKSSDSEFLAACDEVTGLG